MFKYDIFLSIALLVYLLNRVYALKNLAMHFKWIIQNTIRNLSMLFISPFKNDNEMCYTLIVWIESPN